MDAPLWYGQLTWSDPMDIRNLEPGSVPRGAGIYAFTVDPRELSPKNALYIGRADGARQTLRTRIAVYRRRLSARPGSRPSRHRGMEQLAEYYSSHSNLLYIRWTGVVVARDIEGSLIDLFDPRLNNKSEHRHGFSDDELIPDDLLY